MDAPTPPSPAAQALSTVDCYTCRRRRVRCDRVLPGCAKCARTQLECLGYKKPLVWNKGVASRGKMMGKTFPVPAPPQLQSQSQSQSHFKSTAREKIQAKSRRIVRYDPAQITVVGDIAGLSPIEANNSEEEDVDRCGVEGEIWSEGASSPYASSYGASSPGSCGSSSESSGQIVRSGNIKHSLSFIKPCFMVDLDATDRYYLDYFDKRVCRDFILFEKDGDNPYRNLLPMAAQNPSFLHAALAVAARHHSNNCNFPETHALVYKGRAYRHLYSALQTQATKGVTEPVLAAMLLFLFFEALDSGKDTWKIHLRAARRLIQVSGGMRGVRGGMSSMLSVLITHVAAIDIIGRSLAFSGPESDYQPWGSSLSDVFHSLKEAEDYSFLGCPAELLKIILCITLINNQSKAPQQECNNNTAAGAVMTDISDRNFIPSAETLLSSIHAFSPEDWLQTRLPRMKLEDQRSYARIDPMELFHHVSAYKCAVHIFAIQVLSPPLPAHTAAAQAALTNELILHLSCLSTGSVLYKGAVWTVFIAGTGATTEFQREFVRCALKNIWSVLPQFNIKNAGTLLEEMWRDADREGVEMGGGDWKARLAKGGIDWLFI